MKVLLASKSGTEGDQERNLVLRSLFQKLGAMIEDWDPTISPALEQDCLILAHSTTRTNSEIDSILPNWAQKGAAVVLYSGGGNAVERDEACGAGRIIEMHWSFLKQVIEQLTNDFDLASFRSTLESLQKRHVINALVIVAWCATFPSGNNGIRSKQADWLSNREKWLKMFENCTPEDFGTACGVVNPSNIPNQLSAVKDVVEWLWPSSELTPRAPDFNLAISQIKTRFSVHV